MLTAVIQFCIVGGAILTAAMVFDLVEAIIDRNRKQLRIPVAYLIAFLAAGILAWQLLTPTWPLSFWTTMQASIDVHTYGHLVEHAAENILVWTDCVAVIFGLISASVVSLGSSNAIRSLRP